MAHLHPNYQYFKYKGPFMNTFRKVIWHSGYFQKFGLHFFDLARTDDLVIKEAIRRMPAELREIREKRILRSNLLSMSNEYLPKEEWTKWEDETWDLNPYLKSVERDIRDGIDNPFILPQFLRNEQRAASDNLNKPDSPFEGKV